MTVAPHDDVLPFLDSSSIVVCCGTGGVGKTSVSAALALAAAERGRRAIVVTIDPARRLADAIGLRDELHDEPVRVAAMNNGEMWASMLDVPRTFDSLIKRYSADPEQEERITSNLFYRNVSRALSGTRDYIAAERVLALHSDPRFDLVIVDTPPTRSALDFIEAPDRLARFLEHRLFRLLVAPSVFGMKIVSNTLQPVVRTIGRVVGGDAIADAIEFLKAFGGMEQGFRERARQSDALLRDQRTSFVLVATGRRDTLEEASHFLERLRHIGIEADAVIGNRMPPRFGNLTADDARNIAASPASSPALESMCDNLGQLIAEADAADANLAAFRSSLGSLPYVRISERTSDVVDLGGISDIARSFAR